MTEPEEQMLAYAVGTADAANRMLFAVLKILIMRVGVSAREMKELLDGAVALAEAEQPLTDPVRARAQWFCRGQLESALEAIRDQHPSPPMNS